MLKNMLVKMGSSSPILGVNIKIIFESTRQLINGGDPNHLRPSWDDPPSNDSGDSHSARHFSRLASQPAITASHICLDIFRVNEIPIQCCANLISLVTLTFFGSKTGEGCI